MPNFKTLWNLKQFPRPLGEINTRPSETIPDQTMSIQELARRYAVGLPLHMAIQTPVYNGEEDLPDFKNLDLAEQADYIEAAKARYEALKQLANQEHNERLEAQAAEERALREKQLEDALLRKYADQGITVKRTSGGAADTTT